MDSEIKQVLDPAAPAAADPTAVPRPVYGSAVRGDFYRARDRFYMSLLIFVVAVGLPIISVPALRHKLSGRIQALREAMAGGKIKPVTIQVGENKEPFPAEYAKKVVPPNYPKLPPYFAASQGLSGPIVSATPLPARSPARSKRTIRIPSVGTETESQAAAADAAPAGAAGQDSAGAEPQPQYQQGQMEKEAYDFLLKSNPTVNGMVQGSNPSLHFKSWDALKREEDAYWVRLTFTSVPDNTSVEYIWQVKLLAKQITPLSYNARSLASP
ncbi:MAG TPA: hypothetical protein VE398_11850 [Acidobacteriota bacterium]|nr:hypothetical protein [Acidobacteriota bacterium]